MSDHPATDEHRRICSACRLEAAVLGTLDREMAPVAGDDLLVARLARNVSAKTKTHRRRSRVFVLLAAAALTVITGIASGYYAGVIPRHSAAPPATPTEMESVRDREAPTGRAVAAPPFLPVAPPATTPAEEPTAPSVASIAVPVRSAADMFAEANQARKDGDIDRSIVLYRELTRAHPKSGEAATSHVTLARILFMRNDARSALTEYDAYLDDAKNTTLREEALAGRAKCLEQLGPRDQEKKTWQMLLDEYPQSLYADHARKRLGN